MLARIDVEADQQKMSISGGPRNEDRAISEEDCQVVEVQTGND